MVGQQDDGAFGRIVERVQSSGERGGLPVAERGVADHTHVAWERRLHRVRVVPRHHDDLVHARTAERGDRVEHERLSVERDELLRPPEA